MGKIKNKKTNTISPVVVDAIHAIYTYLCLKCPAEETNIILEEIQEIAKVELSAITQWVLDGRVHSYSQLQEILSKINEKESIRKSKGVYYTPNDVVSFILNNSIRALFGKLTENTIDQSSLDGVPYKTFCYNKTVFDPTCGAGEFLITALETKLHILLQHKKTLSTTDIRKIVSTIHGNDVNRDSVIITELRILLCIVENCGTKHCVGLGEILKANFTTYDFVQKQLQPQTKFHIIVGNPPYVEDSNSGLNHKKRYGNIYANVLINAAQRLEKNGAIGFVIPLSYVSTPRMQKLRDELGKLVPEQYILSYADRPDCLFDSVHQKLCILIGKEKKVPLTLYTSNYQYWYKEERPLLFKDICVVKNTHRNQSFIPKLGTATDIAIYEKVIDPRTTQSIYDISRLGNEAVFLNRRETFWMKAYRTPVDDPEYKVFRFLTALEADFCYCIINSSLFWWYWICVSDCWHVSKALNEFRMPMNEIFDGATELANALLSRLEATKEYVGTKQTQYEYKHRNCLDEIHAIDDFINQAYGLTETESEYIKKFAIKYRTSGGTDANESN